MIQNIQATPCPCVNNADQEGQHGMYNLYMFQSVAKRRYSRTRLLAIMIQALHCECKSKGCMSTIADDRSAMTFPVSLPAGLEPPSSIGAERTGPTFWRIAVFPFSRMDDVNDK